MALIECPECGGKVSDQAPACIHCGFPLNQTGQDTTQGAGATNETKTGPFALVLYDVGPHKVKCGSKIIHYTGIKAKEATSLTDGVADKDQEVTISVDINADALKTIKKDFDELQCGTSIIDMGNGDAVDYNYIAGTFVSHRDIQGNVPKCPTCGSMRISKIGNLNRAASVAAFGAMSKKINKSFKCENCGYTW